MSIYLHLHEYLDVYLYLNLGPFKGTLIVSLQYGALHKYSGTAFSQALMAAPTEATEGRKRACSSSKSLASAKSSAGELHTEPWEDPKHVSTEMGSIVYTIGVLESRIAMRSGALQSPLFWLFEEGLKVLFNGREAVVVLTLIVLK